MNEELERMHKYWCKKLLDIGVESFSISYKGDLKEIERFTDTYTREGESDVSLENGHLRFYSFEYETSLGSIMGHLDLYKTIKLTKIEFKN